MKAVVTETDKDRSRQYKEWLRGLFVASWLKITVLVFLGLIIAGLQLLSPYPIKLLTDSVFGSESAPFQLAELSQQELLVAVALLYISIYLLLGVMSVVIEYVGTVFRTKLIIRLKEKVFDDILHYPMSNMKKFSSGDILQRHLSDIDDIATLVIDVPSAIIQATIKVIGVLAIIFLISWQLALVALFVLPFLYASITFFARKLNDRSQKMADATSKIAGYTNESIRNLMTIQSYNQQVKRKAALMDRIVERFSYLKQLTFFGASFNLANSLVTASATALIIFIGGLQIIDGSLTIGDLLVFILYIGYLYEPLQSVAAMIGGAQQFKVSGFRVYELTELAPPAESSNLPALAVHEAGILFRNVEFSYQGKTVLKVDSLEIQPGEKVAFIGPSGSGKTTLLQSVAKFISPVRGAIYIDKTDIAAVSNESLRNQIAIVSQEPQLFKGTIRQNLEYGYEGDGRFEDIDLLAAAEKASANEFIGKLEEGFDSPVEEGGDNFSGGQRQRLAVARAFLKKAPIVLLDEPTSALDRDSEDQVISSVTELMQGKTVLMVTHNHTLLKKMDTVYIVDKGKIIKTAELNEVQQFLS